MTSIEPDETTLALAHLVLAQAEDDRNRALKFFDEGDPRRVDAPAFLQEPPPVPTLDQILRHALRIGMRALGRGAIRTHARGDRDGNPAALPHTDYPCGAVSHEPVAYAYGMHPCLPHPVLQNR